MENNQTFICENCGKPHDGSYGSGRFCSNHCRHVFIGKQTKKHVCNFPGSKPKEGGWNCLCGLNFRTRRLLRLHRNECEINPVFNGDGIWNKGLTKESDERIRKQVESYKNKVKTGEIKNYWKDKCLPEETKNKISNSLKNFYKANPDKCTFVKYHKSKGDSYPEIYFMNIFDKNNIEYKKDFYSNGYFLDFAFKNNFYLEIDGEQHYVHQGIIDHDIVRTNVLEENGWKLITRIRWSSFKKLSDDEKKKFIDDLITSIKNKIVVQLVP